MNIEELNKNVEKVRFYKNEEELVFNNVKEVLENINYNYYQSNNTSKLENLENEIKSKLNTISNIHANNITVIRKNIDGYKKINEDTERIFSDLVE